jgi:uncharacterized delta-60 repeat protein
VAGRSNSPNGDENFALVRYNANGTIDTSFGDNTQQPGRVLTDFRAITPDQRTGDEINALALQADGKIVAAGSSNSPNGDQNFALVQYNANGVIDTSFGDNTQQPGRVLTDFRALPDNRRSTDEANAIALQADGKIVAAGSSDSPNGDLNFALVRYHGTPTGGSTPGTPPGTTPGTTSPPTPPAAGGKINLTLTLSALEVKGGAVVTGTVLLSRPAPAGGVDLILESDTPNVASVPGTLTIPAGASSGTFTVTTVRVAFKTEVGIFVHFANALSAIAGDPADVDLVVNP